MTAMTQGPTPITQNGAGRAGDSDLPADPARYDSPRAVAARRRGLEAPYIPGGDDPDLAQTLRRERRDTRRSRKRIGRRGIRVAGAKNKLLDRRRQVAGRCVSRVVELIRSSRRGAPARMAR